MDDKVHDITYLTESINELLEEVKRNKERDANSDKPQIVNQALRNYGIR